MTICYQISHTIRSIWVLKMIRRLHRFFFIFLLLLLCGSTTTTHRSTTLLSAPFHFHLSYNIIWIGFLSFSLYLSSMYTLYSVHIYVTVQYMSVYIFGLLYSLHAFCSCVTPYIQFSITHHFPFCSRSNGSIYFTIFDARNDACFHHLYVVVDYNVVYFVPPMDDQKETC